MINKQKNDIDGSKFSTPNYDELLNSWSKQKLQKDVGFSVYDTNYTDAGESARQKLIDDFNWKITDGGLVQLISGI